MSTNWTILPTFVNAGKCVCVVCAQPTISLFFQCLLRRIWINNKSKLLQYVSLFTQNIVAVSLSTYARSGKWKQMKKKNKLVSFGTLGSFRFSHSFTRSSLFVMFFVVVALHELNFRFVWLLLARTMPDLIDIGIDSMTMRIERMCASSPNDRTDTNRNEWNPNWISTRNSY